MKIDSLTQELEQFYIYHKMLHSHCVQNALMLCWHFELKPLLVDCVGHYCVLHDDWLIDPSVGCIWHCPDDHAALIKQILLGKQPDHCLSWYTEKIFNQWWNYTYKKSRSVDLPDDWDIDLKFSLVQLKPRSTYFSLGRYSDYVK
tara:strand:- start:138 stop:572 length:435 start_codon:yes stop_codon:yes gene_type:complete